MKNKLLSIVVPTKNRFEYLKSLISIVDSFDNNDIELVIEDNSDDNTAILEYLQSKNNKNIIYNYDKESLSVVENSDRAIKHSSGKYVAFIGDDDLISKYAYDFVKFMDKRRYDSAVFQVAKYYWPGIEFKAHNFPNLIINNCRSKIENINARSELKKILKSGATSLGLLPKVYHGIVLRERLNDIYAITGTYFPGPSPDMANAIALALVVKKHIYCDLPFVTAGASPKSTAGLGTKHQHEANIKDINFLPKDTEEKWNSNILKIWTGPTIYAQSALCALDNMKHANEKRYFNYNYHYAFFRIFCSTYKTMLKEFNKSNFKYNASRYYFYCIKIFVYRAKEYLKNIMLLKFHINGKLFDNLPSTLNAEKYVDKFLKRKYYERVI